MTGVQTCALPIFLYSDELYPEDYVDGQVNGYNLNQKQYEKFKSIVFTDVEEIHEWCMKNLESDNIYLASEFESGIASFDNDGFDYHTQKFLLNSDKNS